MATTTSINPYRGHDSSVSLYQVPEFVVDGEKMLFHALYGNEAYEKLRKFTFSLLFQHVFSFFPLFTLKISQLKKHVYLIKYFPLTFFPLNMICLC